MKSILFITLVLFFSTSVHAEFLGLTTGRSARVQAHAKTSIELGSGWYSNQLEWAALRVNIKPIKGLTLFFDYAKLRVSNLPINASVHADFLGYGVGGGVVFAIPDFLPSFDIAFKGAYHAAQTTNKATNLIPSPMNVALKQQQWNADLIISPIDPLFEDGLFWYGTVGYVSTSAYAKFTSTPIADAGPINYRDKSGWSMGAGIVKPLPFVIGYIGVEWLSSEPLLSAGFRYSF